VEKLEKEKGKKISEASFRTWIIKSNLYEYFIEKQKEHRSIKNKDCGKYN